MLVRRLLAVAVAGVVALAMTACGPAVVTPTPTPTEVTQEEAYAQAEDAYRAYIDAINSITVDDSATLQAAYARSTGRQNSFDRKEFSSWQAQHWTVSGELVVLWVDAVAYDEDSDAVQLEACLDSTRVQVLDPRREFTQAARCHRRQGLECQRS